MNVRYLLLCASLSLLAACSGTQDDEVTEIPCDDGHGCPNGYSCEENLCVASDASISNDQVQATGEAAGAPAVVEVETGGCKGPSCEIAAGSDVTFRAPELEGYRFTGWSGDERCMGTDFVLMLENVAANIHCVANYVKRVNIAGDTTLPGAAITAASQAGFAACAVQSCEVDQGSSVVITAGDVSGHRFAGFSGTGCDNVMGNMVSVVAGDSDVTCTANYVLIYSVFGNVQGAPGAVVASSDTPASACSDNGCQVDEGGSVTLSAPIMDGYRFTGWSGNADACTGSEPSVTVANVSAPILCTASFVARYGVVSGTTGLATALVLDASSEDAFADCAEGSCDVDQGSSVTVVAPVVAGYKFLGFEGDGCDDPADLSGTTLTLTNVGSDLDCLAAYEALPPGKVNVVGNMKVGVPGAVTASSPNASCSNGICVVDEGSSVTLVAPNLAPAWRFTGWSGPGCSGANLTLALSNVLTDTTCTANYTQRFDVTAAVAANGGGSVGITSAAPSTCAGTSCKVDNGGTATLTAAPSANFRFDKWDGGVGCNSTNATLNLPPISGNTTCTAHFVARVTVSFNAVANGSVAASNTPANAVCTTGSCVIDQGDGLRLTATPAANYVFKSWSCSASTTSPLDLGPVNTSVTCSATFALIQYSVSYSASNGGTLTPPGGCPASPGSCNQNINSQPQLTAGADTATARFTGWSGCSGTVNNRTITLDALKGNVSCTANFIKRWTVTASAGTGGSAALTAPCAGASCTIDDNGSATWLATPTGSYRFDHWDGDAGCTGTNPTLSLSNLTAATTCKANFTARVTVSFNAVANGSVAASNTPANAVCTTGSCVIDQGDGLRLTATPAANYVFKSWSCSASTTSPLDLGPVNTSVTCSATFALIQYSVSYSASNGGTLTPPGGCPASPGSCNQNINSQPQLTAGPDTATARFTGWSGCSGTVNNRTITLDALKGNVSCTANFIKRWTVTASAGTGGSAALTAPCAGASCTIDDNGSATWLATPTGSYRFDHWDGDAGCTGTNPTLSLGNLTAATTCKANFTARVTVSFNAVANGSVAASNTPANAVCTTGSCVIDQGDGLRLTATPAANYVFKSWSCSASTTSPLDLGPVNTSVTCSATFALIQYTVDYSATGGGSVTMTPVVGACGANPAAGACKRDYGSQPVLTASNADASYRFNGWTAGAGGTCSGTTGGTGGQTMTLNALSGDVNCVANYTKQWTIAASVQAGAPAGANVAAASAGNSAPKAVCTAAAGASANCKVDGGLSVALTASSVANYDISSWTGDAGCTGGTLNANKTSLSFTNVGADLNCQPVYTARITITLAKKPATVTDEVTISAPGCASNNTSCTVPPGTSVTITAVEKLYGFVSWTGTECASKSATNPFTATVTQTCTANFHGLWAVRHDIYTDDYYDAVFALDAKTLHNVGSLANADQAFARDAEMDAETGALLRIDLKSNQPAELRNGGLAEFVWLDGVANGSDYILLGQYASGGNNMALDRSFLANVGAKPWQVYLPANTPYLFDHLRALSSGSVLASGYRSFDANKEGPGDTASVLSVSAGGIPDFHIEVCFPETDTSNCTKQVLANCYSTPTRAVGIVPSKAGLVLVAHVQPNAGADFLWLIPLTTKGDLDTNITPRAYSLPGTINQFTDVAATPKVTGAGFVVVGNLPRVKGGDILVYKFDEDLSLRYANYYDDGQSGTQEATGVTASSDGTSIVIAGSIDRQTPVNIDGLFFKLRSDGSAVGAIALGMNVDAATGGSSNEALNDIQVASGGGYFLTGSQDPGQGRDGWALRVRENGTLTFNAAEGAGGHTDSVTLTPTAFASADMGKKCVFWRSIVDDPVAVTFSSTLMPPTIAKQAP
ncbi:MAG: InlB B-repeat-containing protein [Myxococcales bacterium]